MAIDINVNGEELYTFIQVLADFQRITTDKLQVVERDWNKCDESWKGVTKNQFTTQFNQTRQAIQQALEVGEEAQKWLERYDQIIREFENEVYY